jgi:7-cyano-7-deazaguanine reductase
VELKSLKLYLQSYRNQGVFYETVVNQLLDHFVDACQPRRCRVVGAFTARGGITTTISCTHEAKPK